MASGNTGKSRKTNGSGSAKTTSKSSNSTRSGRQTKTSGRTKTTRTSSKAKARYEQDEMIRENAIILSSMLIYILLFISNFGIGGAVGGAVSRFLFGLVGLFAYVLPICLGVLTWYCVRGDGDMIRTLKAVAGVILCVIICAAAHLIWGDPAGDGKLKALFTFAAENKTAGGLIGGLFGNVLSGAFGKVGAWITLVILTILCLVILFERSFVSFSENQGRKVRDAYAYEHARQKERRRIRREVREKERELIEAEFALEEEKKKIAARRTEMKTKGVLQDTKLTTDEPNDTVLGASASKAAEEGRRIARAEEAGRMAARAEMAAKTAEQEDEEKKARMDDFWNRPKPRSYFKKAGQQVPEETAAEVPEETDEPVYETIHMGGSMHELTVDNPLLDDEELSRLASDSDPIPADPKSAATRTVYGKSEHFRAYEEPQEESETYSDIFGESADPLETAEEEPEADRMKSSYSDPLFEDAADEEMPFDEPKTIRSHTQVAGAPAGKKTADDSIFGEKKINPEGNAGGTFEKRDFAKNPPRDFAAERAAKEQKKREAALAAYQYPPISLLKPGKRSVRSSEELLQENAERLVQVLADFGVAVTVDAVSCGPSVTRYELQPASGVKVSRIVALADDIKLNLAVADVRIEAPIPGKKAVGIEVPNAENEMVALRDLLDSSEFKNHKSRIAFAVGKDIGGQIMVTDIAKMPHVLIAGATGSGKSVCINTLIMSILYKAKPDEVKLIMVDPKVVELSCYNGIPHLMIPVVTDPKKAAGALNWAVAEMTKRYQLFAEYNVRNLEGYNEKIKTLPEKDGKKLEKLPQIVIIVDELADLMMVASKEVEDAICRLAQLARAAGIHLVIATQRPSVNVITGLIKANMPSRIAFAVSSGVDSRTIIDMNGAEKLLGKGDMLFYPYGYPKPLRVQGAFVSDEEVSEVVSFLSKWGVSAEEHERLEAEIAGMSGASDSASAAGAGTAGGQGGQGDDGLDPLFADAARFIIEKDKASIGMLQRWFKVGFNRAARIMDSLAEHGIVGEDQGTKPREILMTMEQLEEYLKTL